MMLWDAGGASAGANRSGQGTILGALYGNLILAGARSLNALSSLSNGTSGFGPLDQVKRQVAGDSQRFLPMFCDTTFATGWKT
jgi:hypothetical protein